MVSFNPRARRGRDIALIPYSHRSSSFQSTRPQGARLALKRQSDVDIRSFNPRARRGRDIAISSLIPKSQFQSTRPQGARPAKNKPSCARGRDVSIHAPAGGATQPLKKWRRCTMFQSTRPQGARLYSYNIRHFMVLTTPERETLVMPKNILRNPDSKTLSLIHISEPTRPY